MELFIVVGLVVGSIIGNHCGKDPKACKVETPIEQQVKGE